MQPDVRIIMEVSIIAIPVIATMRQDGPMTTAVIVRPMIALDAHLIIVNTHVTSFITRVQAIMVVTGINIVLALAHLLIGINELPMILVTGPQTTARDGRMMTVVTTPTTTPVIIILRILSMVAPARIHQDTAVKLFVLAIIVLSM